MKHFAVAFLVIGFSNSGVRAEAPWAEKLFKGVTSHDFGSIPRGSEVSKRFYVTNIYAVDLQITDVRVSCGCASVYPATRTLKSKQTSYIDVHMDARKFTGYKAISIYVSVGPEYISTATLRVVATSRTDVVFNPGHVNFGVVSRGRSPKQTIEVDYAGSLNWKITGVVKDTSPLDVTFTEAYRRSGQVGYKVTVALKANAPAGNLKHQLQLRTNDKSTPILPVLVEGNIQATLKVSPSSINMDELKVNETKTRQVLVTGNKPFRITGVDGQGDGVSVTVPSKVARVHVLAVTIRPTKAGNLSKKLIVKTDMGGESVSLTVEGKAGPTK